RRRRAALTCLECRRRKVKCDRQSPCGQCVTTQVSCIFRSLGNDVPATKSRILGARTHHTSPSTFPAPSPKQRASPNRTANDISLTLPPTTPATTSHRTPPTFESPLEDGVSSIWPRLPLASDEAAVEQLRDPREHGSAHEQVLLNKTRMPTWGHILGTAAQFRQVILCFFAATGDRTNPAYQREDNGTKALVDEMGVLLAECKRIARRIKQCRPSRTLSGFQFDLTMPSRDVSDVLANLYFAHFESTHRILLIPSFWAEYEMAWSQPQRTDYRRDLKILLVLALGLSVAGSSTTSGPLDIQHKELRGRAEKWIYAAQFWLAGPLEKDRLNISGIQIHCLTLLSRQIFSVGGDLVWMSGGALLHTAMQIGLHRDPVHLSQTHPSKAMSTPAAEVRRRLWATVLELAVQMALDASMPARISVDEFDTLPPANIDDEELMSTTAALSSSTKSRGRPERYFTDTSIQLLLLVSIPLRLRVLQRLNSLSSESSYVEVLAMGREVTDAHSRAQGQLVRFITWSEAHRSRQSNLQHPTTFHVKILDLLIRRFLIHLHCSYAAKAHANPTFHFSLRTVLDVAVDIMDPGEYAAVGDHGNGGGGNAAYSYLLATAGGMFREAVRSGLCVVCAELLASVQAAVRDGGGGVTMNRSMQRHVVLLKSAATKALEMSLDRIRLAGETNIKGYMFIRLVLAQIAALENGATSTTASSPETQPGATLDDETLEYRLAREGRDSLVLCRDLVIAWAVGMTDNDGDTPTVDISTSTSEPAIGSTLGLDRDEWSFMDSSSYS
ncbi:hypothetical protein Micbo1qcDRAFT_108000, partial [Microdochium bolleyi]